jgi:hypothetical protein
LQNEFEYKFTGFLGGEFHRRAVFSHTVVLHLVEEALPKLWVEISITLPNGYDKIAIGGKFVGHIAVLPHKQVPSISILLRKGDVSRQLVFGAKEKPAEKFEYTLGLHEEREGVEAGSPSRWCRAARTHRGRCLLYCWRCVKGWVGYHQVNRTGRQVFHRF